MTDFLGMKQKKSECVVADGRYLEQSIRRTNQSIKALILQKKKKSVTKLLQKTDSCMQEKKTSKLERDPFIF